jgi:hypothetical protein
MREDGFGREKRRTTVANGVHKTTETSSSLFNLKKKNTNEESLSRRPKMQARKDSKQE